MGKRKWIMIVVILIYCLALRYMFSLLFPFILALICYFMMKPLVLYLQDFFHICHNTVGIILLCVIDFLFAIIMGSLCFYIFTLIRHLIDSFPYYYQTLFLPIFNDCYQWMSSVMSQEIWMLMQESVTSFLFQTLSQFPQYIYQIPSFLFSFMLFFISSFFLVLDYEKIRQLFSRFLPLSVLLTCRQIKNQCMHSLWIYIKCQMILTLVCFICLCFGFFILKFPHALMKAFIIALLDSLPFIGVGIVLIPMSIYYFLKKQYVMTIYIIILYLWINILRSILEPQLLKKEMQIPSFILLLSMILHMYVFGFIGVILSPIHLNLFYSFLDYYDYKS